MYKIWFDKIFSLFAIILLSPLYILLALLIKLSSEGPIFYKSHRIGFKNKPIVCLKFRTMHVDADRRLEELLASSQELAEEWRVFQKLKKDPRIHFIGNFLRKTSLDELPQFFNVLKGDLSVVGPRPFLKSQVDNYLGNKVEKFLSVKPGLTGIWQVSGRSSLSFHQRLVLDELYIDSYSLLLDVKIILKTIFLMFFPKSSGAY